MNRRRHPPAPSSTRRSRRRAHDPGRIERRTEIPSEEAIFGEAAHALFLQGREAEDAGDVDGALHHYVRALAIPEPERHPADTEALYHHMASCAARIGQGQYAWELYVAAARHAHEHQRKEQLEMGAVSTSLAEAGLLLIDLRLPTPIRESVSHALLLAGVAEALDETVDALLGATPPSVAAAMKAHRRLTGLMVLAGFASADIILKQGALALYNRIALPFERRHAVQAEASISGADGICVMFKGLSCLYEAVGNQERPEQVGVPPTWEEVDALRSSATFAFTGASWPLMSRWLGSYLRDRRGAAWATDEVLAAMKRE